MNTQTVSSKKLKTAHATQSKKFNKERGQQCKAGAREERTTKAGPDMTSYELYREKVASFWRWEVELQDSLFSGLPVVVAMNMATVQVDVRLTSTAEGGAQGGTRGVLVGDRGIRVLGGNARYTKSRKLKGFQVNWALDM